MVPFNSVQGPDDSPTSNLTMNLEKMNGCGTAKIRSSPEKLPPESNALGEDDIDGVKNSENNEITDDESSVDLAPPDSPAGSLITDSGEESAGDDNENFCKLPIGTLNGSTENYSDPFYQLYGGQVDGPRGRRPLRGIKESPSNKESKFIIANSKTINQWWIKLTHYLEIENLIKIITKLQDTIHINKTVMAAFVGSIILVYIVYNFVRPVNESSLKSIHYLSEEILNQYPAQDKQDLKNFIRTINNVNIGKHEIDKVAVVTMLYSHKQTAECLAKTAANYAVKVINRNGDYVRLNGSWNNANFYLGNGDFKRDIEDKGVLVVYDFHNFPAEKVRYFHGICDKHTPYIEDKAVYIILLEISKKQEQISKKHEKVQSRIEELWSSLKPEILNPLATRLMDNVVVVRQEPELFFC